MAVPKWPSVHATFALERIRSRPLTSSTQHTFSHAFRFGINDTWSIIAWYGASFCHPSIWTLLARPGSLPKTPRNAYVRTTHIALTL